MLSSKLSACLLIHYPNSRVKQSIIFYYSSDTFPQLCFFLWGILYVFPFLPFANLLLLIITSLDFCVSFLCLNIYFYISYRNMFKKCICKVYTISTTQTHCLMHTVNRKNSSPVYTTYLPYKLF